MSLISIDQFEHFVEEFPEMEQCYSFVDVRYDDYCKDSSDDDEINDEMIFDFLREIAPESTMLPENY